MKHAALILTALLALTACQSKDKAETTTTETKTETTTEPSTAAEPGKTDTADSKPAAQAVTTPGPVPAGYTAVPELSKTPVREFKAEPAMSLQDGKDYYALIDTNRGQILADLYEQETPVTVNNFVFLARNHYFDGIRFHRVIDGFMAQSGDPKSVDDAKKTEWGTGGPGYQFADEFRTRLTFDAAGILAMANSGPATNGSQFFITFGPTEGLNGKHTIFGKVVTGDDVLPKLTRTSDTSTGQETPIEGAVADQILSVRILTKG
ncbi:peptidylprolyl isomerase [Deinococcus multiflagellatus]|uniref:Peptidyl-prolyl cis-trans isomerase n=1 Tax=Deinococcus multiflagellatus TaxID=1656887 RepID=A0ABW1ZLG7_9DEIO|nr:peptidylprolyl isomerase [Deinococcus multiflagellatus]MBZ9712282.1 peptidylprolyl isomerase [Deinococcus multiflagellatus]